MRYPRALWVWWGGPPVEDGNRPAAGQPVKSIRNQMKYFSFPVGYPPPLVAIWTWS
jgi:hypothetical protein